MCPLLAGHLSGREADLPPRSAPVYYRAYGRRFWLYSYSLRLEQGHFERRTADYTWAIAVIWTVLLIMAYLMESMVRGPPVHSGVRVGVGVDIPNAHHRVLHRERAFPCGDDGI